MKKFILLIFYLLAMDVFKRKQNEKEFENWTDTSTGGRKYWFDVIGQMEVKRGM